MRPGSRLVAASGGLSGRRGARYTRRPRLREKGKPAFGAERKTFCTKSVSHCGVGIPICGQRNDALCKLRWVTEEPNIPDEETERAQGLVRTRLEGAVIPRSISPLPLSQRTYAREPDYWDSHEPEDEPEFTEAVAEAAKQQLRDEGYIPPEEFEGAVEAEVERRMRDPEELGKVPGRGSRE